MVLLNRFSEGFSFGLGFWLSLVVVVLGVVLLMGGFLRRRKNNKLQKKLTQEMLDSYLDEITKKNNFEEAATFKKHIEQFRNGKEMDAFWREYKIAVRIRMKEDSQEESKEESKEDSIFGMEKVYYIKKRKE